MYAVVNYPYYEVEYSVWFDYNIDSVHFNNKTIFNTIEEVNKYIDRLTDIKENLKNISNAKICWSVYKVNKPPMNELILYYNSVNDKDYNK